MMRIPTPSDLGRLLARPLPYSGRPLPLVDPRRDPGIFGPASVTWRVMAEPLLILGGGRALLMQAAHPLVAAGAIEHSSYATDPFGRLQRTIEWVTVVCYGTTSEARRATRHINRLHRAVEGPLHRGHATDAVPAGAWYSGRDPELLRWVHATFVDTMLVAHDAFVGGLSGDSRDAFVREWDAVAALMGVPARLLWRDHAALSAYVNEQVEEGPAIPGEGSRRVAETVLRPPVSPVALRPGWEVVRFTTVGLLPPNVRRHYRITWTPAHSAAHAALCTWLRTTRPVLPRRFRVSPVYDRALARAEGRWPRVAA